MQELIDMLRSMAGSCKQIAASSPTGVAHAVQATRNGSLPGIRAGLGNGIMLRITIERENNVDNAAMRDAQNQAQSTTDAWNTLWVDPEHGVGDR
jgi:hypothetical protein